MLLGGNSWEFPSSHRGKEQGDLIIFSGFCRSNIGFFITKPLSALQLFQVLVSSNLSAFNLHFISNVRGSP